VTKAVLQHRLTQFARRFGGTARGGLGRIAVAVNQQGDDTALAAAGRVRSQLPTVFFVGGLQTEPFPSQPVLGDAVRRLEAVAEVAAMEVDRLRPTSADSAAWSANATVDAGSWHTLYLYNQGVKNGEVCRRCPGITAAVEAIPALLTRGVFGNVFLSVIDPGTRITEHCGPTNIRSVGKGPISMHQP